MQPRRTRRPRGSGRPARTTRGQCAPSACSRCFHPRARSSASGFLSRRPGPLLQVGVVILDREHSRCGAAGPRRGTASLVDVACSVGSAQLDRRGTGAPLSLRRRAAAGRRRAGLEAQLTSLSNRRTKARQTSTFAGCAVPLRRARSQGRGRSPWRHDSAGARFLTQQKILRRRHPRGP